MLLLFVLLLLPSVGNAHCVDSLLHISDLLIQSHNIDSAIVLADLAIQTAETEHGKGATAVATVLYKAYGYNYMAGRYDRSEELCRRTLAIRENQSPRDNFEIARTLRSLGATLYQKAQYAQAESTYVLSINLMEDTLGPDDVEVAKTIDNLGLLYADQGRLDDALTLHQRALAIKEAALGPEHAETARSLNILAALYTKLGDYPQAEQLYRRALGIREKGGTENHSLLSSLNNLANLLKIQARYPEAEELLKRALSICRDYLGPDHQHMGTIQNNLAGILSRQAKYEESEELYLRSLRIIEHNLGPDHPAAATILTSLGDLRRLTGRFHEADSLLRRSLGIRIAALGPDHYDIASNLNSLATLCRLRGNYADAELLYNQATNMYMKTLGKDHPDVANAIMARANLKLNQGQYAEAEALYRQANQIFEKSYTPDHPALGLGYQNLANLFYEDRRYEEAEALYGQALDIAMATNGREHPGSALIMFNLGLTLERLNRLVEADSIMTEALDIRRRLQGPRHRDVGLNLGGLSHLRVRQGQFDAAESMLIEALSILTESLGPAHPELAIVQNDLAWLHVHKGNYADALQHYEKSFKLKRKFLDYAFSFSSEGQKLRWLSKYPLLDDATFSLAMLTSEQGALRLAGNMILSGKSAVVDAMMAEQKAVICSEDPDLQAAVRLRAEVGTRLANLVLAVVNEDLYQDYRDTLSDLVHKRDSIETDLSRRCGDFSRSDRQRQICVADVAQALPPGSVLWEFLKYSPIDFDVIGGEEARVGPARYLGFVLSHSGESSIIDLGPADQIDSLVYHARRLISEAGAGILSSVGVHLETLLRKELQVLYDRVFSPMTIAHDDITKIFVSPDGVLNLLPLQVLPMNDGSYVIEHYSITYLSSGRDLLDTVHHDIATPKVALMLADPDFDRVDSVLEPSVIHGSTSLLGDKSLRPMSPMAMCLDDVFPRLNHSREGIRSSSSILRRAGVSIHEHYGIDANERMLKGIAEPPWILHIATHGVFCEDTSDFSASRIYSALIGNGLALAGVNLRLGIRREVVGLEEDGFLTALEVSGLNLMGTQLVFLAACETGVGVIVSGEGVFGLRRAFHNAGVQSLVMSLWRTPDKQTSELTRKFYEHWLGGMDRGEALRQAALDIINQSRSARRSAHPLLWGGFVLVGN